jgi:hypothetical protein
VRTFTTFLLAGLLTSWGICGCSLTGREPTLPQAEKPVPIHSLVILPTTVPQLEQNGKGENIHQLQNGAKVLDELYNEYFGGLDAVTLLPEERQEALIADFTGSPSERARLIGEKLGSGAVLATTIMRFSERQGTKYAIDKPASVAFRFQLILVSSGKVACVGQFAETQKPLTENIFAFPQVASRGFKWVTAQELAREGLKHELDECAPVQRLHSGSP